MLEQVYLISTTYKWKKPRTKPEEVGWIPTFEQSINKIRESLEEIVNSKLYHFSRKLLNSATLHNGDSFIVKLENAVTRSSKKMA